MTIEMKGIVMDFGPVRAVDHVDFTVEPGEIVGLLGENGAGKSTLMNVLAGTFPPTAGEILIDGEKVRMNGALQAMKLGIRFIHQELNLCDDLNVFENLYLGQELTGQNRLLNKKEMAERTRAVLQRMHVKIDPWTPVRNLQPAEKQIVEIARALLFKCDLIIMDEPTTALSNREIENLFVIMRQLKAEGVSFIYISHKMPEIFEVCETYYVLRDGKLVGSGRIAEITESAVTEMMIGRSLAQDDFSHKEYFGTDQVALEAENLSGNSFEDVNFQLHNGEIIAITGLQSSGRDMLADALFGVIPHSGTLKIKGKQADRATIRGVMRQGVAMVPRSRKERGILNDLSIIDNNSMGFYNTRLKKLLINPREEKIRYRRVKDELSIKADNPKNPITSLSGGNQQKVILGRWLETNADVLIFDNPTQGIDVGTKFEIYHLILGLAKAGKAILVFSAEFPEIYKVADLCVVMYKGRINAVLPRDQLTEKNMMYYSTGSNLEGMKHEQSNRGQ
ncbi:MAG: sugar ABC transporter ATP-binding protein [Eubacteriales bacterium]|nr:sugar ABC transporter ATP-binding protein [Eubacteriales bacterium]